MIKSEKQVALYVTLEPGDATHYEFVILNGTYKPADYVTITRGGDGAQFRGYSYRRDEIERFFERNPKLKQEVPKKEYEDLAQEALKGDDGLIGYITSHSDCCAYTALAALVAFQWTDVEL